LEEIIIFLLSVMAAYPRSESDMKSRVL